MSIRWMVLASAVVLPTAACSSNSVPAPYLTQPAASCPAVDALAQQRSTEPLPADFRPVSAVRCTFRLTIAQSPASNTTGLIWDTAQHSTGPFDEVVQALRLPPGEQDGDTVCPAIFTMPVLLALTDASGHTTVPALPGTACRSPRPEVSSALGALTWTEITHAR